MTNGEKHIEKLLSWYKEAVTEDGVCYLTSDDKNTLAYVLKCCKHFEDIKKDNDSWMLRNNPSGSEKPNRSEILTGSDDCVSRKAVLKIYDEWFATCNIADKKESPKAKINALPPVTPIRPKGHWINIDTNMYACNKCSHVLTIDPLDNSIQEMNTCPFCGTKMEGVEE